MKKFYTFIAAALFSVAAMAAETATFTFEAFSGSSINMDNETRTVDSYVSLQFLCNGAVSSSTGDPQPPLYNKNGYMAFYSKNQIVVTGTGVEITKVTFNCTSDKPSWVIFETSASSTLFNAASPSWTGTSENPLTFQGKSAAYIASITVEYNIKKPQADDTSAGYIFFGENELQSGETANAFSRSIGNCVFDMTSSSTGALVDSNSQYFGTADDYFKTSYRWKPNTKTNSAKATMTKVTVPADGKLTVYARTANDADERTIIISQNNVELVNKVLHESDAIEKDLGAVDAEGLPKMTKIYPEITVEVAKGVAEITWPVNGIFIYGYKYVSKFAAEEPVNPLKETTGINAVSSLSASSSAAYNLAGQRVAPNAKGIVIINGKKYMK